jgi:cytochrome P450
MTTIPLENEARLEHADFYTGDPFPVYARLRNEAPVFWYEPGQLWAISKYEDIRSISTNPNYSVERGMTIGNLQMGREQLELAKRSGQCPMDATAAEMRREVARSQTPPGADLMLQTDPPRHTQLRRLVNRAFTPRVLRDLEPWIRQLTCETFDRVERDTVLDFVEAVSMPVPMYVIAELLGIPREDWADFKRWSDAAVATADIVPGTPEAEQITNDMMELFAYLTETAERRRNEPRDDLISGLIMAEIDGEALSMPNVVAMSMLLLAAGNETTRNLISGTAKALAEHPDQRAILIERPELLGTAVDEFLRWITPAMTFGRTAMVKTSIRGQTIEEGDFVFMLYQSANRDEEAWERAATFDVTRQTDPMHLAFGFGTHVCLGQNLARLETRIVFEELLRRFPNYELVGEIERLPSTIINGIQSMPARML